MCTQDDRALLQGITVLRTTTQTRTQKEKPSPFSKSQPNGESLLKQGFKAMMNECIVSFVSIILLYSYR